VTLMCGEIHILCMIGCWLMVWHMFWLMHDLVQVWYMVWYKFWCMVDAQFGIGVSACLMHGLV
jgi:hypothetical protein